MFSHLVQRCPAGHVWRHWRAYDSPVDTIPPIMRIHWDVNYEESPSRVGCKFFSSVCLRVGYPKNLLVDHCPNSKLPLGAPCSDTAVYCWSYLPLYPTISPIFTAIYYTGWWFGTWILFFSYIGNVIIPTDELIFFRGVGIPPTRYNILYHFYPFTKPLSPWYPNISPYPHDRSASRAVPGYFFTWDSTAEARCDSVHS